MFLAQMESVFVAQHQQKLEVVERPGRRARFPGASYVDDEASPVLQHPPESFRERTKPVAVAVRVFVAVRLLSHETERRGGHDEVDGFRRRSVEEVAECIAVKGLAEPCLVPGSDAVERMPISHGGCGGWFFFRTAVGGQRVQAPQIFDHRTESQARRRPFHVGVFAGRQADVREGIRRSGRGAAHSGSIIQIARASVRARPIGASSIPAERNRP